MNQMSKVPSSDDTDIGFLTKHNVPQSEMDKAAVLTLIREEVCLSPISIETLQFYRRLLLANPAVMIDSRINKIIA